MHSVQQVELFVSDQLSRQHGLLHVDLLTGGGSPAHGFLSGVTEEDVETFFGSGFWFGWVGRSFDGTL